MLVVAPTVAFYRRAKRRNNVVSLLSRVSNNSVTRSAGFKAAAAGNERDSRVSSHAPGLEFGDTFGTRCCLAHVIPYYSAFAMYAGVWLTRDFGRHYAKYFPSRERRRQLDDLYGHDCIIQLIYVSLFCVLFSVVSA